MAGDGRCRLLVKGVNPVTSRESLQNYFEVMSKENVDDHVIFAIDRTEAMVTMAKKPGIVTFLDLVKTKKVSDPQARNISQHV